ncbi:MAG: di-heme oxidoredictase family protein, partial [Planctomycetaceae bacterium]
AFLNKGAMQRPTTPSAIGVVLRTAIGLKAVPDGPRDAKSRKIRHQALVNEVRRIHPGFTNARSVVVHLFGTDDNYANWRERMVATEFEAQLGVFQSSSSVSGISFAENDVVHSPKLDGLAVEALTRSHKLQHATMNAARFVSAGARRKGSFTLSTTQRNPTALYGAGAIDAIPDSALIAVAESKYAQFPQVTGRVARLPGNKIGRFGWKAQKPTLRAFAMTACAVELGLHVPEHPQAGHPSQPQYKPAGFDMNQRECDLLVEYLQRLPQPVEHVGAVPARTAYLAEGKQLFAKVGCTACHIETLGEVTGLYSDLLLHDMGDVLGDTGDYGVFIPDSPGGDAEGVVPPLADSGKPVPTGTTQPKIILGATRLEWKTPPLWGIRDSAPYLHDGRAKTMQQAIAFHAGEAQQSATLFFALNAKQRLKMVAFLKSLVAPRQVVERR